VPFTLILIGDRNVDLGVDTEDVHGITGSSHTTQPITLADRKRGKSLI
jgi:hypothetical protein